jgi:hypothetical protein
MTIHLIFYVYEHRAFTQNPNDQFYAVPLLEAIARHAVQRPSAMSDAAWAAIALALGHLRIRNVAYFEAMSTIFMTDFKRLEGLKYFAVIELLSSIVSLNIPLTSLVDRIAIFLEPHVSDVLKYDTCVPLLLNYSILSTDALSQASINVRSILIQSLLRRIVSLSSSSSSPSITSSSNVENQMHCQLHVAVSLLAASNPNNKGIHNALLQIPDELRRQWRTAFTSSPPGDMSDVHKDVKQNLEQLALQFGDKWPYLPIEPQLYDDPHTNGYVIDLALIPISSMIQRYARRGSTLSPLAIEIGIPQRMDQSGNYASGQLKAKRWLLSRLAAKMDPDSTRHSLMTAPPKWKVTVVPSEKWCQLTTKQDKHAFLKTLLPPIPL